MGIKHNIVAAATTIKQGVKGFVHNVRVEFEAQKIAAAMAAVEREQARIEKMSPVEQMEYMFDNAEILQRAAELRARRN
jgi:hypothetical protein